MSYQNPIWHCHSSLGLSIPNPDNNITQSFEDLLQFLLYNILLPPYSFHVRKLRSQVCVSTARLLYFRLPFEYYPFQLTTLYYLAEHHSWQRTTPAQAHHYLQLQ